MGVWQCVKSALELRGAPWYKSSYSGPNCDNCVEVAQLLGVVAVRDSKDAAGPAYLFVPAAWQKFVAGMKRGDFEPAA
jgi:hypothetical protein